MSEIQKMFENKISHFSEILFQENIPYLISKETCDKRM